MHIRLGLVLERLASLGFRDGIGGEVPRRCPDPSALPDVFPLGMTRLLKLMHGLAEDRSFGQPFGRLNHLLELLHGVAPLLLMGEHENQYSPRDVVEAFTSAHRVRNLGVVSLVIGIIDHGKRKPLQSVDAPWRGKIA